MSTLNRSVSMLLLATICGFACSSSSQQWHHMPPELEDFRSVWQNPSDIRIDEEVVERWREVDTETEITVFLGTWCGDSRRELPRFWAVLDQLERPPLQVTYVLVDRTKVHPAHLIERHRIHFVPTFLVHQESREVGRIVERSPSLLESDLVDLLSGEKKGFVSGSTKAIRKFIAESAGGS